MSKMFEPGKLFVKLDRSSQELRKYAEELADFLSAIKEKSVSMVSLIKCLRALKTMPIDTIDNGINNIQIEYLNLHKEISSNSKLVFDAESFKEFIQKNEKFNQQAQHLFAKAVELYQSSQSSQLR